MAVDTMVTRRRFTRAEYYRMVEVGILRENDRIELIKGEIVEMSPIGRRHNAFVGNLTQLLVTRLAGRAIVWVQSSIALSEDTEPQPDFVVLRRDPVAGTGSRRAYRCPSVGRRFAAGRDFERELSRKLERRISADPPGLQVR